MSEPRNQFTFYRSYYDAIQELPKKDQSAIMLAVCAYAIYEVEPKGLSAAASTAFKLIRPTLDAGRKKAQSGKQGGSKPKAKGKQTAREKEVEIEYEKENEYETEIECEEENEYETEIECEEEIDAEAAYIDIADETQYGTKRNISLTQSEYDRLILDFGETNVIIAIETMGKWMAEGGQTYERHYDLLRRKLKKMMLG